MGAGDAVGRKVAQAKDQLGFGSEANRMKDTAPMLLGAAVLTIGGGTLLYRRVTKQDSSADTPGLDRAITIGRPADELYRFWREPAKLAQIMAEVAEVRPVDGDRTKWTAHGPLGRDIEWEMRIVEDRPGEYMRWESGEGSSLSSTGSVRFRAAPGDRGTEVLLHMQFDAPGGAVGDMAAKLAELGHATAATAALRRFKSLVETGEIPTLDRNSAAREGYSAD